MSKKEYTNCFLCGSKNPVGLQLDFTFREEKSFAEWTANKNYEGYENTIHGGIIASLIDEAVAKIILENDIIAVTTELSVKYIKPFKVGDVAIICGEIIEKRGRIINGKAVIYDKNNPDFIYAEGFCKYFVTAASRQP